MSDVGQQFSFLISLSCFLAISVFTLAFGSFAFWIYRRKNANYLYTLAAIFAIGSALITLVLSANIISSAQIQYNLANIQSALDTTCGERVAIVDATGYIDDWDTPTRWEMQYSAVGCYWDGNVDAWQCVCPTPNGG
jgi:hypothetical protein